MAAEDVTVAVVDGGLGCDEFTQRFRNREPVLLRGLARDWPALSKWMEAAALGAGLEGEGLVSCLHSRDLPRFR